MNETTNENGEESKKGLSKKVIAITIGILLVIGASVAAYVLLDVSDKEKYFLAEKNTVDFMKDTFKERYEPEVNWQEQTEENPTNTVLELSAEYNNPYGGGYGMMNPQELINNSSVIIDTTMDKKNKQLASELKADFAGLEIGGIHFYLTDEEMMAGLPFLDEVLQIKANDLGSLLHELDPDSFTGEEEYDFGKFFDGLNAFLSKEDMEYFQEEYFRMVYDELPESAFAVTDETVKMNEETIDTEKITLHLSENNFKGLLKKILNQMQHDEKLKELLQDQYGVEQLGSASSLDPTIENEVEQFINDFESTLQEAQDALKDFQIPGGLTSTIWVKNKVIVKRDLTVNLGPTSDELVALSIKGTQLLGDENQTFDYALDVSSEFGEESISITGDLTSSGNKSTDSIKLAMEEMELAYESNETLKDGKREFERAFSMDNSYGEPETFIWSGNAAYDNDQMNSEHTFSIESPDMDQDMLTLHIAKDAKTVKDVDIPKGDNVKDLGSMSLDELQNYVESEVAPQAQEWMYNFLGGGMMNGL